MLVVLQLPMNVLHVTNHVTLPFAFVTAERANVVFRPRPMVLTLVISQRQDVVENLIAIIALQRLIVDRTIATVEGFTRLGNDQGLFLLIHIWWEVVFPNLFLLDHLFLLFAGILVKLASRADIVASVIRRIGMDVSFIHIFLLDVAVLVAATAAHIHWFRGCIQLQKLRWYGECQQRVQHLPLLLRR